MIDFHTLNENYVCLAIVIGTFLEGESILGKNDEICSHIQRRTPGNSLI